MPGCVPVNVDREPGSGPDQVPFVAGGHFISVGETDGLDAGRGIDRPETQQRIARKFVVLKVGSCPQASAAAVYLDLIHRVGPASVGKGVAAGERKIYMTANDIEIGWPGFDLPDSNRLSSYCGRCRSRANNGRGYNGNRSGSSGRIWGASIAYWTVLTVR